MHFEHNVRVNRQLCYLQEPKVQAKGKQDYLILISYNKPDEVLEYYRTRWQVERLFFCPQVKLPAFNFT